MHNSPLTFVNSSIMAPYADGVLVKLTEAACIFFFFRHRFIIGKEEIPTHSVTAEHICPRPLERTAAVETEDSQVSAERSSSRRKTLVAYTRELLESM